MSNRNLKKFGYALLEGIFGIQEMQMVTERLSASLSKTHEKSVLRSRGHTYGSRDLLKTFPEVSSLLTRSQLKEFITSVLGPNAGIVRVLYFDKPPDRTWSLPWHKDRTIAVKRNDIASDSFCKPTMKGGVAHVEAPISLLSNMLTLRLHLDPMIEENGPLSVIPRSHNADDAELPPVQLRANVGDVLAMRPLLTHSSTASRAETTLHRRVVHFELSSQLVLPDGYEWHSFLSVSTK